MTIVYFNTYLSPALTTDGLDLAHYPRTQVLQADLYAGPAAGGAPLHSPLGAPLTIAVFADDGPLDGQLPDGPVVHFLQAHLYPINKLLVVHQHFTPRQNH